MAEIKKTRRQILTAAAGGAVGLAVPAVAQSKPAALAADLVKEFVIAGHGNLPRVREMLTAEPRLLNACWDWGGGDFETALEGAGHMGHQEIARFLIGKGARINIFQAAMLDEIDVVKAMLASHPELAESKGPHGIPLVAHAKAGSAKRVLEHLEKLR